MSKKKIVIAVSLAVIVVLSAVTAVFFVKNNDKSLKTPIPDSIDTSATSLFPVALSDYEIKKESLNKSEESEVSALYSETYKLVSYSSDTTFITATGLTAPVNKINEYYAEESEKLAYTVVIEKEISATYNANGNVVKITSDYAPKTDYDTENVSWFFKDGKAVLAEMSFYDKSGNFGTAYYSADGSLLCVVTEIYTADDSGVPTIEYTYYNSSFEITTKESIMSSLPSTDADSFLYINW
ncbi:MAG: hypothetical protein IJB86_02780 [Clostridia bacterium]|nr:hypothetical protein [Clostridia bacterium]